MKTSQILAAVVLLLVLAVLLGAGCTVKGYNHVTRMDEDINQAWAEVDNQLKRRAEMVPELVATVKGVAGQEQTVFLGVANARKAYFQAQNVEEKEAAARQMDSSLSRLLALQEQYPKLKSNEAFLKLQDSLEGTENRLTVARQRYNTAVMRLNAFSRQFPGKIFASLAGIAPRHYFETEAEQRTAPKVDFSDLKQ